MKLVVISPEGYEPREHALLAQLFAAGLERYHLRKPRWAEHEQRNFLSVVPQKWHCRFSLHQHHGLVQEFGCGGVHFKEGRAGGPFHPGQGNCRTSRSCHSLSALETALGHFDSVFFSPVFPSISKPGYQPTESLREVAELLSRRNETQRRTRVIALGGVTPGNAARCAELGFDGVAVLGSLWQSSEPLKVFEQLQQAVAVHAA